MGSSNEENGAVDLRGHSLISRLRDRGFEVRTTTSHWLPERDNVLFLILRKPGIGTVGAILVETPGQGYTLYVETPYLIIEEDIEHVERTAAYHASELPAPVGRGA